MRYNRPRDKSCLQESNFLFSSSIADIRAAGYTAGTHTAGNNGCVRSHTAAYCKDTLSSLHTLDIFRRGLQTNQNNLFASCVPSLCVLSGEYDLTAGSARRCSQCLCRQVLQPSSASASNCGWSSVSRFLGSIIRTASFSVIMPSSTRSQAIFRAACSCSLTVSGLEHVELACLQW